jgi:hypothetical protein
MSQLIGILFGGCNHVVSATDPGKVVRKYGLFDFEEDINNSPWFVPIPLKFAHLVKPLPHKFKNHLPLFHGNGTVMVIEHVCVFSNSCAILGVNNNDTCMLLFMNSLLLELLHTHLGFLFPKVFPCLLVIISHYPVSYILGENIPPGEYSLSVDTSF